MAIWAVAFNANFTVVSNAAYSFLTNNFGWLYLMAMTAFVIFSIAIAFSKWGKIKPVSYTHLSCIFTVAGLAFVFIRFGFPRTEE